MGVLVAAIRRDPSAVGVLVAVIHREPLAEAEAGPVVVIRRDPSAVGIPVAATHLGRLAEAVGVPVAADITAEAVGGHRHRILRVVTRAGKARGFPPPFSSAACQLLGKWPGRWRYPAIPNLPGHKIEIRRA
jgi:hypothetical protein